MEHPHNGETDKDGTGNKKSDDEFSQRGDIVLPSALRPVSPVPSHQDSWHVEPPASSRFFDKLAKLVGFYGALASAPRTPGHETGMKYSGTIIVETNHHDIDDLISRCIASTMPDTFQTHELVLELRDDTGHVREVDARDAIEYIKANAPSIMITAVSDLGSRRLLKHVKSTNFLNDKVVVVVLVNNLANLKKDLVARADFIMRIDHPTGEERVFYLTYLLGPDPCVDHALLAGEMDGWTWDDMDKFCKHVSFQQHVAAVERLSTNFLLDLLQGNDGREAFTPPSAVAGDLTCQAPASSPRVEGDEEKEEPGFSTRPIIPGGFCDPFAEQLWQVAASYDYLALASMLERLERGTIMPEDHVLLVKYPFVLRDNPITSKTLLDAAKNKVDLLSRTFKPKKG